MPKVENEMDFTQRQWPGLDNAAEAYYDERLNVSGSLAAGFGASLVLLLFFSGFFVLLLCVLSHSISFLALSALLRPHLPFFPPPPLAGRLPLV